MSLKNKKPHVVSVNMESYMQTILGLRKTGKTTLFRDLVYEKYKDPMAGLCLAFEKGYDALNGIVPEDIEDWTHFENLVDELIYDKKELSYKLIAIDTIDEMVFMAEEEAIAFYNRRAKQVSDRASTINEAGGGFNRGKAYAISIIRKALSRLLKAGYGIVLIGHSKDKKIKLKDGTEYSQLTCNLTSDYTDIFLNSASLITFLTTEKKIKGNSLVDEQVYMNFRGLEFDCGNRFKHVPARIEYGAKNYIKVFEDAVAQLVAEVGGNHEQLQSSQKKENDIKAEMEIEKMITNNVLDIISNIKNTMKEKLSTNLIDTTKINEILQKYKISSPDEIKDIKTANSILSEL